MKTCNESCSFFLHLSADAQFSVAVVNTNVIVQSSGDVLWPSAGIFKSVCGMNVEYFPFDVQTCNLKFASWAYDGSQVYIFPLHHVYPSLNVNLEKHFTVRKVYLRINK